MAINGSRDHDVLYAPFGGKIAPMAISSLNTAWIPLANGAETVYNASGFAYDRHPNWLGSSRLAYTPGRGVYFDTAYSSYGNPYANTGTTDYDFTGQNADTVNSGREILYDSLFRDLSPWQGRGLSPDPAGLAAVNPDDPRSWNRYAYGLKQPNSTINLYGMDTPIINIGA